MTINTYSPRGLRLDQYVVEDRPLLSRAYAAKLINEGVVLVNGAVEKPGYRLRADDMVEINFDQSSLKVIPVIKLPIIYEDKDVLVVDKPSGVISHARGKYWDEPSVASFLRQYINDNNQDDDRLASRAGIVHRLDRFTSGVMICAKNQYSLRYLQKQFNDRSVEKTYIALIKGHLKNEEAVIDMPIERNPKQPSTFRVGPNGKAATTQYRVLQKNVSYELVELKPKTGRTHQIRVHLKKLNHPIVGDKLYGGEAAARLMLHARDLTIQLPDGKARTFISTVPEEFNKYLQ